jgi:hypothetical protein
VKTSIAQQSVSMPEKPHDNTKMTRSMFLRDHCESPASLWGFTSFWHVLF